jgi:16S rRNA (guanine527-N7)-methyltransferase
MPYKDEVKEKIDMFVSELLKWSSKINITGYKTEEEIRRLGVDDSIKIAQELGSIGKVLDIGAGAGFPSIPAKIVYPNLKIWAIESSYKKCAFLRHIKTMLSLDGFEIIEGRAEDRAIVEKYRGFFDIVTGRAINPNELVELARPYSNRIAVPFGKKLPKIPAGFKILRTKKYRIMGRQRGIIILERK